MVMELNDWVFLVLKRLRDQAQELMEPAESLDQALELADLVSGESK